MDYIVVSTDINVINNILNKRNNWIILPAFYDFNIGDNLLFRCEKDLKVTIKDVIAYDNFQILLINEGLKSVRDSYCNQEGNPISYYNKTFHKCPVLYVNVVV